MRTIRFSLATPESLRLIIIYSKNTKKGAAVTPIADKLPTVGKVELSVYHVYEI